MTPSRPEGAACRYCQGDHNQRVTVDRELLIQLEDFLDDRADVVDGDYGEPRPNRAMQLLQDVRAVLEGSSEGTGAILHPVSPLSSFSTTGAEEPSGTTLCEAAVAQAARRERHRVETGDWRSATADSVHESGVTAGETATPAHTVPPVADLGPAESQPARDPASDVHAGGGEPALVCPDCIHAWGTHSIEDGMGCVATVEDVECACPALQPLLPDYVTPLRKLAAELGVKK